jgi:hypothetical protein
VTAGFGAATHESEELGMTAIGGLDHCILLVRDLDAADRQMARLGFRPTPRGIHSAHMGTGNSTIVLEDRLTYIELMGVLSPTPANAAQRAALDRRQGPYGIAFKSDDAQAAARRFAELGIGDGEAVAFSRPVVLPEGTREAAFTVARTRPGATPGAWLFVCQHHTPELVWRQDRLEQANGVTELLEVVGVADDLDLVARTYGALLGDRVSRHAKGVEIPTGTAVISFLLPEAMAERFGALAAPAIPPALVVLRLRCRDRAATRRLLEAAAIPTAVSPAGTLLVSAGEACGTLLELD